MIAATVQDCLRALLDFPSYPDWQSAVRSARVTDTTAEHTEVDFEVDVRVKRVRYTLRYHLDGTRLWWESAGGDIRSIEGDYTFEDLGDGTTRATYTVAIDPGRFVPGPVRRVLIEVVMKASVRELKARVERA